MTTNNKKSDKSSFILAAIVFAVVVFAVVWSWFHYHEHVFPFIGGGGKWEQKGQFGDSYGALNTLFSGLAFAVLIFTMFLQGRELSLQRQELQDTRETLQEQSETMKQQRFENTFFQMLSLHNEILEGLRIQAGQHRYHPDLVTSAINISSAEKRKVFEELYQFLGLAYRNAFINVGEGFKNEFEEKDRMNVLYDQIYDSFNQVIGHYFRNLFRIFCLIRDSGFDETTQQSYSKIVRAQLSDDELLFMFYNGLSKRGVNFKEHIEHYSLFDNLPKQRLIDEANHRDMYKISAWGDNYKYSWEQNE